MTAYEVEIDGDSWWTVSESAEYDAIHAAAGAVLAGATEVEITRHDEAGEEEVRP